LIDTSVRAVTTRACLTQRRSRTEMFTETPFPCTCSRMTTPLSTPVEYDTLPPTWHIALTLCES